MPSLAAAMQAGNTQQLLLIHISHPHSLPGLLPRAVPKTGSSDAQRSSIHEKQVQKQATLVRILQGYQGGTPMIVVPSLAATINRQGKLNNCCCSC